MPCPTTRRLPSRTRQREAAARRLQFSLAAQPRPSAVAEGASLFASAEHSVHLHKLPDHHKDPFDRLLICQAIAHGMALLTPDEHIARYPVPVVW